MKTLFIMLLMVAGFTANAQTTSFSQTASNPTGAYTGSTVDTMTVSYPATYSTVGVQVVITKVSGTVAGTAILYGSINGTNYVATGDTLTLTNVTTNTAVWSKTSPVYTSYRILCTGSGTMAATAAAKIIGRRLY